MTKEDIAKLRELEKVATPDPWYETWQPAGDGKRWVLVDENGAYLSGEIARAEDAILLAHTRRALPALLDAAEENERMRAVLELRLEEIKLLYKELAKARKVNERLREALEDMIDLAAALDDDDPYYGAQRATARLESALAALKGGK